MRNYPLIVCNEFLATVKTALVPSLTTASIAVTIALAVPALTLAAVQQKVNSSAPQTISQKSLGFSPSSVDAPLPRGVDADTGFRMNRYRGPVPESNPGTETVDTQRATELYKSGVVFIDVFPPRGLGADPIDGTWITNETHDNIKGSTWLPEVGRGFLEEGHIEYFTRNLTLLSNNNKHTPLLFYCTADCWQSWNAAQRARQWGYTTIFWYPAGTDGWIEQEQHSLVPAEPVNFLGEATDQ